MIDTEKIKQAALAATQGEWKTMRRGDEDCLDVDVFKSGGWNGYVTLAMGIGNENAIHIAAANPSAVLELITRLETAEKDTARIRFLTSMDDDDFLDFMSSSDMMPEQFTKLMDEAMGN